MGFSGALLKKLCFSNNNNKDKSKVDGSEKQGEGGGGGGGGNAGVLSTSNPFKKGTSKALSVGNLVKGITHAGSTALNLDTPEHEELGAMYYISAHTVACYACQMKVKTVDDFRLKAQGQQEFDFISHLWNMLQSNFNKLQERVPSTLGRKELVHEAISKIAFEGEEETGLQGFEHLAASLGTLVETLEHLLHISPASRALRTVSKLVDTKVPYVDDQNVPLSPLTALYIISKQGLREIRFDNLHEKSLRIFVQKHSTDALFNLEYYLDKFLAIGPLSLDSVLNWNKLIHETEDRMRLEMLEILMGVAISVWQILEQLRDDLDSIHGARYADVLDKMKTNWGRYQLGMSSHHYLTDPTRLPLNAIDNPDLSELLADSDVRRALEAGRLLMLLISIRTDLQSRFRNLLPHAENIRSMYKTERDIVKSFMDLDEIVALQEDAIV